MPNPFYVKETRDMTDVVRSIYEICAFLASSSPFLLLTILKLKTHLKNKFSSFLIIQIIVSLFPFIFITQWINPFYRYYIFEYPVLIILGILSLYLLKDKLEIGKYSKIAFVVAIIFLITFNLPITADVTNFVHSQSNTIENTHIKIGKILAKYPELKHNTIATIVDAGAIPYFSKWQTYDYTLNDKMTVQHGFSVDRFYENEPKLMFFYHSSTINPETSIEDLERMFMKKMNIPDENGYHDEIVTNPKFENYELLTIYLRMHVFAEKEFSLENPNLINELKENSKLRN